jgi:hypothetical protein
MGKVTRYSRFIVYPLIFALLLSGIPASVLAETINIVTYYPAPFGMYRQMGVTDRLTFDEGAGIWVSVAGEEPEESPGPLLVFTSEGAELHGNLIIVEADDGSISGDIVFRKDGVADTPLKRALATAEVEDRVLHGNALFVMDQFDLVWNTAEVTLRFFVVLYWPLVVALVIVRNSRKILVKHKIYLESQPWPEWWSLNN